MLPYLMAFASSAFYGVADFLGGMGARRANVLTVTAWFQICGVVLLVAYAAFAPGVTRPDDLAWAALAGVCGGLGVTLLYHALAIGVVSTAAPLVSLVALTVPVVAGLLAGERPGVGPLAGIVLGACAVVLVSGGESHGSSDRGAADAATARRGLWVAAAAGLLVGFFLVALARVQPGSSGWPLVAGRVSASVCLWALVVLRRAPVALPAAARAPMLGGALTDVAGNILYLLAVQRAPVTHISSRPPKAPP
ncbi:MAG: EamA family transporter, partial [bacterium]